MTAEISKLTAGLDSNIVTYLAEAMATGYNPWSDPDEGLAQLNRPGFRRGLVY